MFYASRTTCQHVGTTPDIRISQPSLERHIHGYVNSDSDSLFRRQKRRLGADNGRERVAARAAGAPRRLRGRFPAPAGCEPIVVRAAARWRTRRTAPPRVAPEGGRPAQLRDVEWRVPLARPAHPEAGARGRGGAASRIAFRVFRAGESGVARRRAARRPASVQHVPPYRAAPHTVLWHLRGATSTTNASLVCSFS